MSVIPTREQVPRIMGRHLGMAQRAAAGAGPKAAGGPAGMTGRDIMRILRKRKWLIRASVWLLAAG